MVPPPCHRACPLTLFPGAHLGVGPSFSNFECRAVRQYGVGGSRHCVGGHAIENPACDGCRSIWSSLHVPKREVGCYGRCPKKLNVYKFCKSERIRSASSISAGLILSRQILVNVKFIQLALIVETVSDLYVPT